MPKKIKEISPWTLKLSSEEYQVEFTQYLRTSARGYLVVLIPVIFVIAILFCFVAISSDVQSSKLEMFQGCLVLGSPSLIAILLLIFSYKNLALVELVTPVMILGYSLMVAIINITNICGVPTDALRHHQMLWCIILYTLVSLFMGVTWRWHIIIRVVAFFITQMVISAIRIKNNDQ